MIEAFKELWQLVDLIMVQWFGWVLFLGVFIYMLFWLRRDVNRNIFTNAVKWVFLEVKIEETNEKSPLAMEQVFAALHAIHTNYTWGEKFAGKIILWVSCELVSLGGKVSYIFKVPERYRSLLESAVFAQYPKAEIYEVEDYLKNMPHEYYPDKVDFDFWGTQWLKKKENAYPIKTFGAFEHPEQKTFIDPLANVIEALSNIQPYELMAMQLVIRPIDDTWKANTKHLLDKLKGAPAKHGDGWFDRILIEWPSKIMGGIVDLFIPAGEETAHVKPVREEPPSQMLHKTEGEKQIIASIEHALSKIYFEVKFRTFYLAPKDKFNKALRIPEIVGAIRNFDDVALSGPKPDVAHTWTDAPYKLSETLEAPYLRRHILTRKRRFWHGFLLRSVWRGIGNTFMNTEELASLYHFPQAPNVRMSQVERVSTVKTAPPPDLPVG